MITREDLDAIRGVEGGLKAFAEDALERSLGLGPSDRDDVQGPLHAALQPAGRRDADDLAGTARCLGKRLERLGAVRPSARARPVGADFCARTSSASRGTSLARTFGWATTPWPRSPRPGNGNGTRRSVSGKSEPWSKRSGRNAAGKSSD